MGARKHNNSATVVRTESHLARFNNARAMFEKMSSRERLDTEVSNDFKASCSNIREPFSSMESDRSGSRCGDRQKSYRVMVQSPKKELPDSPYPLFKSEVSSQSVPDFLNNTGLTTPKTSKQEIQIRDKQEIQTRDKQEIQMRDKQEIPSLRTASPLEMDVSINCVVQFFFSSLYLFHVHTEKLDFSLLFVRLSSVLLKMILIHMVNFVGAEFNVLLQNSGTDGENIQIISNSIMIVIMTCQF